MYFSATILLSLVSSLATAAPFSNGTISTTQRNWEVVAYDTDHCNDNIGNQGYRLLTGSDGDCHRFRSGEGPPCEQFWDGGFQGPVACDDVIGNYPSAGGPCHFFTGEHCEVQTEWGTVSNGCNTAINAKYKSFRCVSCIARTITSRIHTNLRVSKLFAAAKFEAGSTIVKSPSLGANRRLGGLGQSRDML
jgi:hypothetical protein